jgi:hypothetical protein
MSEETAQRIADALEALVKVQAITLFKLDGEQDVQDAFADSGLGDYLNQISGRQL